MDDDESLCIEVLKALQQMLEKELDFGDKVRSFISIYTRFGAVTLSTLSLEMFVSYF